MSSTTQRIRVIPRAAGALAALSLTVLALATPGAAVDRGGSSGFTRHTITQQVSLTDGGPADQTLSAVVHEPTARPARGIQVLLHGATYDHRYFDLKTTSGWVSQARTAAKDGWISVAVDRIGNGESSHPAADRVNNTTHAVTIHQLVTKLKSTYKQLPVALVGHSQGSMVAIQEAATYKDVDAVVSTGMLHHAGAAQGIFGVMMHSAAEDPAFEGRPVPAGYLTSRPGLRHLFYWPFNADLSTVEADDAVKQITTQAEGADFLAEQTEHRFAKGVDVPVLSVVGEHDTFFFDPADRDKVVAAEPAVYAASPEAEVKVIPNAGHDLALQRNTDLTTKTINTWLSRQL